MKKIILASGSPRRRMLLEKLGIEFEIVVSEFEELLHPKLKPSQQAAYLSKEKAKDVSKKVRDSIIISADTTVVIGDLVLGKPKDRIDAIRMLGILSGKMHKVITGFTVLDQTAGKTITRSSESKVWFRELNTSDIEKYIDEFEPFDKAGSYGIQDIKVVFLEKIVGDYTSILGLPLPELSDELKKLGVKVLRIENPV